MTNWQISSPTIFICPDCEFEQREMTERCPHCGKRRLIKRSSRHHLYRFKFLMNRGMKKEKYLILLTTAQFEKLSSLDEQDVYDQVQSKYWDHVIEMYDDKGCDYDSIFYKTECLDEDGKVR
jgi:DNA-directed RNA polymerase subunit RPC12/RpoP